ncbi:MAG TPA: c-type cytochrome domain-containing protein, partial [Verrucomicrobiae bacterium]|nr:c-type cytochrome domain-containing protein [Verrucomicrobiae bacterium]
MKRVRALFLFVVAASLWRLAGGGALEATAGGPDAKRVAAARAAMLVLKAECFACHNEEKKKGGLVLTSGEGLLKGGEEGPVVSPGKPEASPLVKALAADADPHMPPKKQLAEAQIKVLRDWVQAGATWNQAALSEEDPKLPVKLAALPAAYQPVLALALSPDGKRLAVARGGSLVLHDGSSTNFPVLAQREAALDAIQCLAWSPDGKRLAAGAWRHLSLWSGDNLKLEREWETGLAGRVTAAQFSPDGTRLVLADGVAGRGGYARVLNLPDGKA